MHRSPIIAVLLLALGCAARAAEPAGEGPAADAAGDVFYPMLGGNPARDGNTGVRFESAKLGLLWSSPRPSVVYQYQRGQTGSGPCLVSVGGRHLLIAGSYDRNVRGYDAFTGEELWQFTTGDAVTATPCYAEVGGEPMLFVASSDYVVYALNPLTGQQTDSRGRQLWRRQIQPWGETRAPAIIGDPLAAEIDGRTVLFFTAWLNDLRAAGNVQESALYAIDAADGSMLWKAAVGTSSATAPALGKVGAEPALFVVHEAGAVHAFSARTGQSLWPRPFVSEDAIRSGVSYAEVGGRGLLYVGSRLFTIFCIDADAGSAAWSMRVGTWVDSTPAIRRGRERTIAVFGDYQQWLHGADALTGEPLWDYRSYGYFASSPTLVDLAGAPAAAAPCLDDHLYIVNSETGQFILRAYTGEFLWSHYQRGDSVWPPAAAARLGGRGILAVAAYDGRLHVFGVNGEDANVGPPQTRIFDALGGRIFGWVFGGLIVAVLAYNMIRIVRRMRSGA